jgi:stringent starvation protein B
VNRVIAIYARENGQGMAFPVPVPGSGVEDVPTRPSPLSSVTAAGGPGEDEGRIVQLVTPDGSTGDANPDGEPPRPPSGPRPALKRVK